MESVAGDGTGRQWCGVMQYSSRVILARTLLLLAAAAAIEVVPRLGFGTRLEVLPLSEMILGVGAIASSGVLWPNLLASTISIVTAFVSATLLGVIIGYVLWRLPAVYAMLSPYLVSYYAIPIFAFYPILVVMFGANRTPILLIAAGWAVVAVIVSTVEGLATLRHSWEKVADIYRLPLWRRALAVHLPAAWPNIAIGLRLATTYSILGVIASEFILSGQGLGYMVNHSYNSFEFREMWGGILVVFAVGVVLDTLVRRATHTFAVGR